MVSYFNIRHCKETCRILQSYTTPTHNPLQSLCCWEVFFLFLLLFSSPGPQSPRRTLSTSSEHSGTSYCHTTTPEISKDLNQDPIPETRSLIHERVLYWIVDFCITIYYFFNCLNFGSSRRVFDIFQPSRLLDIDLTRYYH